jgi:diguanylate cyclase (GGDEF)-like protein/PAS domain S-box-containing protein
VWARAVADTSFVPMDHKTIVVFLRGLADDLLAALRADELDHAVPLRVGAALVHAHFTEAGSIEHTLAVLGRELRPLGGAEGAGRLAAVQGAVAAGYARALQERTRQEQQEVTASAFAARTAAEQARWASEARFQAVFADALIGIGLADTEGRIVDINRAMCEILGRTPEELSNGMIWTFVHPEDVPGLWDRTKELLAGERNHLRLEKAYFRPDGSEVWTDLVLSLIRDPDGSPLYMVAMMENITERHRLQTRLQHQAQHDPLTDLPNRTLFFERLEAALQAETRPGVCYLDLDGFKAVNDTLGHETGDQLLSRVGIELRACLRETDVLARLGGDEFAVILPRETLDEAAVVAAKITTRLREARLHGVTASVGVAAFGPGPQDADEVLRAADLAMYSAKAAGRDRHAVHGQQPDLV